MTTTTTTIKMGFDTIEINLVIMLFSSCVENVERPQRDEYDFKKIMA